MKSMQQTNNLENIQKYIDAKLMLLFQNKSKVKDYN